ncbi:unnamed protein product [Mytilus coruscus]|uniref:MEGF10_11 n=1 Tax=Mytilus coruscus TaxID=42192 RepID=A0A6J8EEM9_MYTCO|nr:unnamed protein product [Mytilus coruscus]
MFITVAIRMDGFKLYVTNTSTIPPDGYLCYEDPDPGLPNITQTIPCNQLGQYVIYYDTKGSDEGQNINGPVVELCYVAINGCEKSFWGSNCQKSCSENCIEQHCYPGNGSCILGCNTENCLNDICNRYTAVCTNGCKARRTGSYCDKYNVASDGLFSQTPSGSHPASLANDGNKTSCSKTKGFPLIFQVDLKRENINQGVYITFGESTAKEGNHTIYASNTSTSWKIGIILYKGNTLPSEINFNAIFRYLTYVPPAKGTVSELEVCEIEIIGCPPSQYGLVCNQSCPGNCHGPCDLETGNCISGCLNGWTGDKCERECPNGQFGRNCSQVCEGCVSSMCDPINSLCDNKTACIPGYLYGEYCNTECTNGHFGRNCSQVCEGCISRTCSPVNGLCNNTTACSPGYLYGKYCNKPCSHGFYGSYCLQTCSPLCLYQPCDRKTGQCIGGCARGLQGFNCTQGKENATEKAQSHEQQHDDDGGMENVSAYQDLQEGSKSNEYDKINTHQTTYINQLI